MPAAIAVPLISAGIGAAGSIFSAKSGKKTVSAPSYTPEQQAVQSQLSQSIQHDLANPANLDPQKAAAIGQINTNTDNMQTRLATQEAGSGFGRSGRKALSGAQLEINRSGQLGGLEDRFAQLQLDQNNRVRQQAQSFGFENPTTTTTGTGSGLAAGLGSASNSLSILYFLNHILKGGGGTQESYASANPGSTFDGGAFGDPES
jgi:hypothetical protein